MDNILNDKSKAAEENENKKVGRTNFSSLHPEIINWIGDNIDQLIVIINDEGTIIFISNSFYKLLNYDPSSLLGKNIKELIYLGDIVEIKKLLEESEQGQIDYSIQLFHKKNNPQVFKCEVKSISKNDKLFYICKLDNETEFQTLEEMLARSEQLSIVGQIAAGIAHEIRNPLTSIKGFIQLLQAGIEQKDVYYNILIDEINKLEQITSEFLYISKPITHEKSIESIKEILEEVFLLLQPQAKIREVNLLLEKGKDLHIFCNRSQVKQVLINLIKNAIEASDKSDEVIVNFYKEEDNIYINVIDEGEGISKEFINKIEEPFFTTKEEGTGLGLMITRNLLAYHNAKLKVIPRDEKGTIFRVIFPGKRKNSSS